jgi:predicted dehydrogenase
MTKKIVLIGLGKRGRTHLRNLSSIEACNVVAVCDENEKNMSGTIPFFKSYKDMIKKIECDAVIISVPTYYHYKIAKYCLAQNKHVLLEKPLTIKLSDTIELVKMAKAKKLLLMPGYHLSFDLKMQKARDIIQSGEIGKILMVRGRQSHNWGGKTPFEWSINKKYSGGGVIIDNASHYVDLFGFLFGGISQVSAFSNNLMFGSSVEDSAVINLKFQSGIIGTIEVSWGDASGRNNGINIWGSKGVLRISESNSQNSFLIEKYIIGGDAWNRIILEELYIPKGIEQLSKVDNIDNNKGFSKDASFKLLAYFIETINSKQNIRGYMKSHDMTQNTRIIDAIYKSIHNKKVQGI